MGGGDLPGVEEGGTHFFALAPTNVYKDSIRRFMSIRSLPAWDVCDATKLDRKVDIL